MEYVLLALFVILTLSMVAFVPSYANPENLIARTSIVHDYPVCSEVKEVKTATVYTLQTELQNNEEERKSFVYIILVSDSQGFTDKLYYGTFELAPKTKTNVGCGYTDWIPQKSDDYRIRTFIWSDLENPIPLSDARLTVVHVVNKIVALAKGEEEDGLLIKDLNFKDKSVAVGVKNSCPAYLAFDKMVLQIGQHVLISSYARAYFMGFEDAKAIFEFRATGGGLCQLG